MQSPSLAPVTPTAYTLTLTGLPPIQFTGKVIATGSSSPHLKGRSSQYFDIAVYLNAAKPQYIIYVSYLSVSPDDPKTAVRLYSTAWTADTIADVTKTLEAWWLPENTLVLHGEWASHPNYAMQLVRHSYLHALTKVYASADPLFNTQL